MSLSKILIILLMFFCSGIFISCSKEKDNKEQSNTSGFSWREDIKPEDIPDAPVKGFINGKEVNFSYINFEQWRGSGDNVLNFGDKAPKQNCGYIEEDNAFHLMHKSGEITKGEFLKSTFEQQMDEYVAYYHYTEENGDMEKISVPWNCALVITSMEENVVKGKIAMCFKDDLKSWIAGSFEAIRCYN